MCSVCLDVQVNSTSLVPCGHSFCKACCCKDTKRLKKASLQPGIAQCPECRTATSQVIPNRTIDKAIHKLISFFDFDDIKSYYQRMGKTEAEATSAASAAVVSRGVGPSRSLNNSGDAGAPVSSQHDRKRKRNKSLQQNTGFPSHGGSSSEQFVVPNGSGKTVEDAICID